MPVSDQYNRPTNAISINMIKYEDINFFAVQMPILPTLCSFHIVDAGFFRLNAEVPDS